MARSAGSAKSYEPLWFVYTLITKNELLFGPSLERVALTNVEIPSQRLDICLEVYQGSYSFSRSLNKAKW